MWTKLYWPDWENHRGEGKRNICLKQPSKSVIMEHSLHTGHKMQIEDTMALHECGNYWDCFNGGSSN